MSTTRIIVSFMILIKLVNSYNTPVIGEANDVYKVITTNYTFSGDVIKIIWRTIC